MNARARSDVTPHQLKLFSARTCGREKEYSVSSKRRLTRSQWYQLDEAGDAAQRILHTHSAYRTNQELEFLCNASRLYNDHGKLEYATAECSSPRECALHDKAGDHIVADMARQACRDGEILDVHNDNSDGLVSYGCHSSYQILRSAQGEVLRRNLMTFLVSTGAVLFGAGEYKDGVFYRSSRAQFVDKDAGEKTRQGTRAILNTRSEHLLPAPHRDLYTRLHITSLDTKVSDEAIFLEVALTWLVLSASECGWDIARYYPRYPVRALKDISRDIHHPIETESGDKVAALDIQEYLLEQVREFLAFMEGHCELVEWMWQAVSMWEQAISDLRNSAPEEWPPSSYWIDWWAKLHLLQTYQDDCPNSTPDVLSVLATEYHNIAAEKSLAQQMASDGLLRQNYTAQQIAGAAKESSSHPRARRRAYWIKSHSPSHKVSQARWEDVTINGRIRILEFD
jgi:proteasome accessory factor A